MAKDPAFLFYPGDYLRDTQNLSESTQVAYDRIMCEHMRNICITQQQLKFFTKRLNDDEREELMLMLVKINNCFQIEWVAESITKRKAYSESRRKNRLNPNDKISKTYDSHMENENEDVNTIVIKDEIEKQELIYPFDAKEFMNVWKILRKSKKWKNKEFTALQASLKKLSEYDQTTAIAMMMNSIEGGYQGLFEIKQTNKSKEQIKQEKLESWGK